MQRRMKMTGLIVLDVVVAFLAWAVAFLIRFDGTIPVAYFLQYARVAPVSLLLTITVFYYFGLYNRLWQYASVPELMAIVQSVTLAAIGSAILIFHRPGSGFPRSIVVLAWMLTIVMVGVTRFLFRIEREFSAIGQGNGRRGYNGNLTGAKRTLIIGAGDAGAMIARELQKHPELLSTPVGFLDDAPAKQGYRIHDLPVLGTRKDLAAVVERYYVGEVIIAMPTAPRTAVRVIVDQCRDLGVRLKTLPGIYELLDGKVSIKHIRDVQIDDLLGRAQVRVDLDEIAAFLQGQTVLVTGAGGSIGSELCRQIARFGPSKLLVLGHGENSIYEIDLELRRNSPKLDVVPIIADIQDVPRIDEVFARYQPSVVFHAAAHKHVPLMELNPEEAIKNNVFGTRNVASAANRHGASRFVLVSTDKAVNPTSVMGASKRAAELMVQALGRRSRTKFVVVRFGNVLGSRGSVVPLFKRQIAEGGPVSVTHPDMMRYFMTIPEAVQLVIQAAAMGQGGEVFVLDMGEPIKIVDMARDLIRLSGLEPDRDIKIDYTGIRPGEKLFEEMLTAEEGTVATEHEKILIARTSRADETLLAEAEQLLKDLAAGAEAPGNRFANQLLGDIVRSLAGGRTV